MEDEYDSKGILRKRLVDLTHKSNISNKKRIRTTQTLYRLNRKLSYCKNQDNKRRLKYRVKICDRRLFFLELEYKSISERIECIAKTINVI